MSDIYVISYPKSGSTWLARLLGDVLDSPTGQNWKPGSDKAFATEGQDRKGLYYVGHGHQVPTDAENGLCPVVNVHTINLSKITSEKIIILERDPRDIAVSAMHHSGIGSIEKTLNQMYTGGSAPLPYGNGFDEWHRLWSYAGWWIKYEDLLKNTVVELRNILQYLNCTIPLKHIEAAVKRQSFDERKKWTQQHGDSLTYGKEFQLKFLRKGIVGDWKNYFTQNDIDLCQKYFGEFMKEHNYND